MAGRLQLASSRTITWLLSPSHRHSRPLPAAVPSRPPLFPAAIRRRSPPVAATRIWGRARARGRCLGLAGGGEDGIWRGVGLGRGRLTRTCRRRLLGGRGTTGGTERANVSVSFRGSELGNDPRRGTTRAGWVWNCVYFPRSDSTCIQTVELEARILDSLIPSSIPRNQTGHEKNHMLPPSTA